MGDKNLLAGEIMCVEFVLKKWVEKSVFICVEAKESKGEWQKNADCKMQRS